MLLFLLTYASVKIQRTFFSIFFIFMIKKIFIQITREKEEKTKMKAFFDKFSMQ